jgi:hypothetical protein
MRIFHTSREIGFLFSVCPEYFRYIVMCGLVCTAHKRMLSGGIGVSSHPWVSPRIWGQRRK